MPIAHPADKRVLVIRKNNLREYIALEASGDVDIEQMEDDSNGLVIMIGQKSYTKTLPEDIELDELPQFILIDLTANPQVVGVAFRDSFYENRPGEVIFFT